MKQTFFLVLLLSYDTKAIVALLIMLFATRDKLKTLELNQDLFI